MIRNWYGRIGNKIEMLVNGEWIKGTVIFGYRTHDGLVHMRAENGKEYGCGAAMENVAFRKCEDSLGDFERVTDRDGWGKAYWDGKNGASETDIRGHIYGVGSTKLAEYEDAEEQGLLLKLPCRVGDIMWAIRSYRGVTYAQQGFVNEMFFTKKMKLMIVVKNIARGEFGKTVFRTREEAEQALKQIGEGEYERIKNNAMQRRGARQL